MNKLKMNKLKLPTLIAVIVLTMGLAAGVLLLQSKQIFKLGASPDIAPKDVRITNITDTSFTVSWTTDKKTSGFIIWGKTEQLGQTTIPENQGLKNVHSITTRQLSLETAYFLKINSNANEFDNSGIPWRMKTGPSLKILSVPGIISGSILTATGQPAAEVTVFVSAGGISPLSATTSQDGSWVIPLSNIRSADLSSFGQLKQANVLLEIFVQGGPLGVATAKIFTNSANPTPHIILGKTHDFRNEPANEASELPEASINLPEESTPSSGFEIPEEIATPSGETISIESISEGETISSTEPEFFGKGPSGTIITITIESDPISAQTTVNSSGNWNWNPPEELEEGTHQITLSWKDSNDILRTLTRNFIVQAAEGPAFESTPSAEPTASPSPSPTPSASPSASPRVSLPSTESGTPIPGTLTPTLVLFTIGTGLLTLSGALVYLLLFHKQN